jgi:hypothetical protein
MKPEIEEFWNAYRKLVGIAKNPKNLGMDRHNTLSEILKLIRENASLRADFVACFQEILRDSRNFSSDFDYGWSVIPFCMRELRWPEVAEALDAEIVITNDGETRRWLKRMRTAYDPVWRDEGMFLHYTEEHV